MEKWVVSAKRADFNAIAQKYDIDPVIARIIRNRDVTKDEDIRKFLQGTIDELYLPGLLKDMDESVAILLEEIYEDHTIRIFGDYDVDGVCATAILKKGLKLLGARVDCVIPDRMKDGYGLSEAMIQDAIRDGVMAIVTCDNGIAAYKQIEMAKNAGITVVVTDHHEVPYVEDETGERNYVLPPADAVVDPKREDCMYPFPGICGAYVAYKLMEQMFRKAEKLEQFPKKELLELAAFATVCDVMELRDENRILVKYGIEAMRDSANEGIKALIQVNQIEPEKLSCYHIGFVLGPCINATGRIDSAMRALELLTCDDRRLAVVIAGELKQLNEERKAMTELAVSSAEEIIAGDEAYKQDRVLVIYLPECHESLCGIVAGRVRESTGKPTFVLTDAEETDVLKGSGRSIDAYHMYEEMNKVGELFSKYGGHKLAAGLSLPKKNLVCFRERINQNCTLTPEDMQEKVVIDVPMPLSYITMQLVRQLEVLEPFGTGNEKPIFAQKNVNIASARIMGKNKNVGKFVVEDEAGRRMEMMVFQPMLDSFLNTMRQKYSSLQVEKLLQGRNTNMRMDIIYYPDINVYNGQSSLQIMLKNFQ